MHGPRIECRILEGPSMCYGGGELRMVSLPLGGPAQLNEHASMVYKNCCIPRHPYWVSQSILSSLYTSRRLPLP
jgi:hypothetical protein